MRKILGTTLAALTLALTALAGPVGGSAAGADTACRCPKMWSQPDGRIS
jgi:hypothetical protein